MVVVGTQWVGRLAAKTSGLSLITGTNTVEGEFNPICDLQTSTRALQYVHLHTYKVKK